MTSGGRDTPLAVKLKAKIRSEGPIGVDRFMAACLTDPEHGYYTRMPAIGAGGDFVTAPEISQVFGELIGLWCVVVWRQMGAPRTLNLVELGPGRGTMMRDALRAARLVPAFLDAVTVHLVDKNAALQDAQRQALAFSGVPVRFHGDVTDALAGESGVPEGATIVLANEFLDALPVAQFVFVDGHWRTRRVALDAETGAFRFAPDPNAAVAPEGLPASRAPREGDVIEVCEAYRTLAGDALHARAQRGALAALFIDYGHAATGFGDTLQGVEGQAHVSPFHAPGETDLSAQVDFERFARVCREAGLAADGPAPQAQFLGQLGIVERASRLMAQNPDKAGTVEAGVQRLMAPTGMGSRFLALGVRSPELPPLPGFQ